MTRFLRILLFTLLIAAIVFFAFRAAQPIKKLELPSHSTDVKTTIEEKTSTSTSKLLPEKEKENILLPSLENLSEKFKKPEPETDSQTKEKDIKADKSTKG